MPYIKKEAREGVDLLIQSIVEMVARTKNYGLMNYVFTKILMATKPKRYKDFNALIGVLETCKLELYRRMIAPYENRKMEEEGDVYTDKPTINKSCT